MTHLVSGAKKTLGDAHPTTVIIQKNLDELLQKIGKVVDFFSSFLQPDQYYHCYCYC